jgi:anti-sigma regulatory factor (Ser/Thr protein kinase)
MTTATDEVFHLVVPCSREAPAIVRAELAKIDAIEPVREDARLVASEIVSNAVLHSGCTPEHDLDVRGLLGEDFFEISVHDPALTEGAPMVRDNPDIGGLGLRIVERLAAAWGVARPDGRVVWAQLSLRR